MQSNPRVLLGVQEDIMQLEWRISDIEAAVGHVSRNRAGTFSMPFVISRPIISTSPTRTEQLRDQLRALYEELQVRCDADVWAEAEEFEGAPA